MKNILQKIPSTIKTLTVFVVGIILLLHTLGFFKKGLDKAIVGIAIIMIIYGFIELDCPAKIISLFKTKDAHKPSNQNDDEELF